MISNYTKPNQITLSKRPRTWNAIPHLLGFNFRKVVTITCNLCPESSVVQMLINIYRQHNAQIICFRVQYWLERLYSKESQLEGEHQSVFVPIAECICPNYKMYLSKLHHVFEKYWRIFFSCHQVRVHKDEAPTAAHWVKILQNNAGRSRSAHLCITNTNTNTNTE